MGTVTAPSSAREALDMVRAGLGYLAAADAAELPAATQAECLRELEQADRALKLATTFGGAGVVHGDLTPECAEAVGRVLDALGAPAGAEDDRTRDQRYHDGLQEAMRRLLAAGLLPERAGQPVKAWAHISLADLALLDGDSALQDQWTGTRTRRRSCTATDHLPGPGRGPGTLGACRLHHCLPVPATL